MGLFAAFQNKARRAAEIFRFNLWILKGKERGSGEPFCIAYAGSPAGKNYLAHLAFDGIPEETDWGPRWLWPIPGQVRASFPECSLIAFEVEEDRQRAERFLKSHAISPAWMPVEMDVFGSVEASMRKTRFKTMTKKIAAAGLGWEVRTDPGSFDRFYREMYLPYARTRHEGEALVSPREGLEARYREGELIFITKGGEPVAASLVDFGFEKPRFLEMGILNGDEQYLRAGAADAVYYFSFERVIQRGGATVCLGNCRGFLKDGVLLYKISLGGHFAARHYEDDGCLHFRMLRLDPALRSFLARNPMLTLDGSGGYRATAFAESQDALDAETRRVLDESCKKNASPSVVTFAELERRVG